MSMPTETQFGSEKFWQDLEEQFDDGDSGGGDNGDNGDWGDGPPDEPDEEPESIWWPTKVTLAIGAAVVSEGVMITGVYEHDPYRGAGGVIGFALGLGYAVEKIWQRYYENNQKQDESEEANIEENS